MTNEAGELHSDPEVEAFVRLLIEDAARQRLPELFAEDHPDAVYRLPDRHGVGVIALPTTALSDEQLIAVMKYRLAQYLAVGFIDPRLVYQERLAHEPLANVVPTDLHIIAGAVATGELLCYSVLRSLPATAPGATLRTRDRPLFQVEQIFGWGAYNRLRVLPDLPVTRVREWGRFVKNQRLPGLEELGRRAPVEVFAAAIRMLVGPLHGQVDAIVGDVEEGVAKRNMDYFHMPSVLIRGVVPYTAEDSYFFPNYQYHTRYPFAWLTADMAAAMPRLEAIERALGLPGKQGELALLALKDSGQAPQSGLEPPGGLAPLTTAELPRQGGMMQTRRQLLDLGERLRSAELFRDLSAAEAAILRTFMERRDVAAGEVLIRQGDPGDGLYLIESGRAEVRIGPPSGPAQVVATLGPGDYCGEIALVTGAERTADVVAVTPMALLRLGKEAYARYLARVTEVERQLARTAAERASGPARQATAGGA